MARGFFSWPRETVCTLDCSRKLSQTGRTRSPSAISLAPSPRSANDRPSRSPYDRFHFANEENAISASAKRGELLFFLDSSTRCFRCHGGFNFSDATVFVGRPQAPVKFHNTGLYNVTGPFSYPAPNLGIYTFTKLPSDVGKFKAPIFATSRSPPHTCTMGASRRWKTFSPTTRSGRTIASGGHRRSGIPNGYSPIFLFEHHRLSLSPYYDYPHTIHPPSAIARHPPHAPTLHLSSTLLQLLTARLFPLY